MRRRMKAIGKPCARKSHARFDEGPLERSPSTLGPTLLQHMIVAKAEETGKTVVAVNARYSSQTCSRCGQVAAESRRERRFACVRCGFAVHADVNAALVIRRRAELRPGGRGAVLADLYDLRNMPDAGEEPARSDQEVAA